MSIHGSQSGSIFLADLRLVEGVPEELLDEVVRLPDTVELMGVLALAVPLEVLDTPVAVNEPLDDGPSVPSKSNGGL